MNCDVSSINGSSSYSNSKSQVLLLRFQCNQGGAREKNHSTFLKSKNHLTLIAKQEKLLCTIVYLGII